MSSAPLLSVRNLSKVYGSKLALEQVSIDFYAGKIHAVLGENGAGKSTLMGILAGFVRPDSGRMSFEGKEIPFCKASTMNELGISMVHQHFMLVPQFTVEENLALAQINNLKGIYDPISLTESTLELAKKLGWEINPRSLTSTLPVGVRQRIEILKALSGESKILILDEPTAVLSQREVDDLLQVVKTLADRGVSIILIAHKLSEVLGIADEISVLRQGKIVAHVDAQDANEEKVIEWMVGEPLRHESALEKELGDEVVSVRGLKVLGVEGQVAIRNLDLSIQSGEILGIGGVDGNGQIELAEALVGIRESDSRKLDLPRKIGYIPQDRQVDGLSLDLSVRENILLGNLEDEQLTQLGFLKWSKIKEWSQKLIQEYEVKVQNAADQARSLSGGNQQKIIVARVLGQSPEFVICVNPTRGLDVRAESFVHQQLKLVAENGAAVLLISTDRDELEIANRVLYLNRGELAEEFSEALA